MCSGQATLFGFLTILNLTLSIESEILGSILSIIVLVVSTEWLKENGRSLDKKPLPFH
jgi:hypothetical protein